MTLAYGLLLGILGILLTTVGMMTAYIIGYKTTIKQKPKELTEVEISLKKLREGYYDTE